MVHTKVKQPVTVKSVSYLFQLLIVAWDSGNPDLEITTTVEIEVRRNEYKPEFFPTQYTESVSEHASVGTNITRVTATDRDPQVGTWGWGIN